MVGALPGVWQTLLTLSSSLALYVPLGQENTTLSSLVPVPFLMVVDILKPAVRLVARAGRQLDSPDPESLPLVARIESNPDKLKSRVMLYLLRIGCSI